MSMYITPRKAKYHTFYAHFVIIPLLGGGVYSVCRHYKEYTKPKMKTLNTKGRSHIVNQWKGIGIQETDHAGYPSHQAHGWRVCFVTILSINYGRHASECIGSHKEKVKLVFNWFKLCWHYLNLWVLNLLCISFIVCLWWNIWEQEKTLDIKPAFHWCKAKLWSCHHLSWDRQDPYCRGQGYRVLGRTPK